MATPNLPLAGKLLGIFLSANRQDKQGQNIPRCTKFPNSPVFSAMPFPAQITLPYLVYVIPTVTGLFSLALLAWNGTCFVLAALMPPESKEKVPPKRHRCSSK